MHYIPERLTLHLTYIYRRQKDPTNERFHVVSSRASGGVGPDTLDVPFNPINPAFSIREARHVAAKMLGVDYEAIELVHYLQPYVLEAEEAASLIETLRCPI